MDSAAKAAEAATKLSTASRAIFYASVASDNLADALNDASLSKLPTVALVARSTVQTALEVAVEDLLGKKFGRTAIDNLTYGLGSYAGRGVTVKSVVGTVIRDYILILVKTHYKKAWKKFYKTTLIGSLIVLYQLHLKHLVIQSMLIFSKMQVNLILTQLLTHLWQAL